MNQANETGPSASILARITAIRSFNAQLSTVRAGLAIPSRTGNSEPDWRTGRAKFNHARCRLSVGRLAPRLRDPWLWVRREVASHISFPTTPLPVSPAVVYAAGDLLTDYSRAYSDRRFAGLLVAACGRSSQRSNDVRPHQARADGVG